MFEGNAYNKQPMDNDAQLAAHDL